MGTTVDNTCKWLAGSGVCVLVGVFRYPNQMA